jgi:hypothetical protein
MFGLMTAASSESAASERNDIGKYSLKVVVSPV